MSDETIRTIIGYIPVYRPTGFATAAIMDCSECGAILSGMGGPRNGVLCPACVAKQLPSGSATFGEATAGPTRGGLDRDGACRKCGGDEGRHLPGCELKS